MYGQLDIAMQQKRNNKTVYFIQNTQTKCLRLDFIRFFYNITCFKFQSINRLVAY